MLGLFESVCAPWQVDAIPEDFSFGTLPPDWDRMAPYLEKAMERIPVSLEVGVQTFFCGPESFTPDLAPIVGEAPELRNYFVAAGLNSIGILTGGGIGPGGGPVDRRRTARHRRHRHQHRPAAPVPEQPASTGRPARSSRSAWSTSPTTRAGPCAPPAARSSRRCTTGWSRSAPTSAT